MCRGTDAKAERGVKGNWEFGQWVVSLGDGSLPMCALAGDLEACWIDIPKRFLIHTDGDKIFAIIEEVYDCFQVHYNDPSYLADWAIVCPTNVVVESINDHVMTMVPGDVRQYLSSDRIVPGSAQIPTVYEDYPPEHLNGLVVPNYPRHCLNLKVGMSVILLRNLNQYVGLCTGTRLLVTRVAEYVLEATILTGLTAGESVSIPRVVLNAMDS